MELARVVRRLTDQGGWRGIRWVFPSWSIHVPPSFEETFVTEDNYWHAWDDKRTVSLTSVIIRDKRGQPVDADAIYESMLTLLEGNPVDESPPGLTSRAVTAPALQPACASLMLQGMIAAPGRVLLVTVTCDDLEWARDVWLSIRLHEPAPD